MMAQIPQQIKGYEIHEQIGAGGFGAVYRAYQPVIEREVAIKAILPQYANEPEFIRDFEAEARLVARLEHPYIVPLFDYWRDPTGAYLVMRWLRGGNLSERLKKSRISLDETLRWLEQIAAGLTVAHRNGIIHRDIKPANILLDEEGNAYLTDFGLATLTGTHPEGGLITGSLFYISPEQLTGKPPIPASDVYGLGIVLYEMLTGQHPFGDKDETSVSDIVSKQLNDPLPELINLERTDLLNNLNALVKKATAKSAEERYESAQQLALEFRKHVTGQTETLVIDTTDITNPYKGLRPFGEEDAVDFFGRENLISQLVECLQEESTVARFLAVVGPSGSGKSSAVFAGLVPALKRGAITGSENWFVVELVPGSHPLQKLEAALLSVATSPPENLLERLQSAPDSLLHISNEILADMDTQAELLIIIDQFEEIFTLLDNETERIHFLNLIYETIRAENSRIRVITTLRADFYHKPLLYENFGSLMQARTQLILPLTAKEIEQVITGPAKRVGLTVDTALVAAIVADVREEPGALPLMQYALTEVFERRDGQHLTLMAYRESGGVLGALARRAEEVYTSLTAEQQAIAHQVFMRLVSLGEGTEDTRRTVHRAELASIAPDSKLLQEVLSAFGKYRLFTFDQELGTREPLVQLAHEAIIREWNRLGTWLNENRDNIRQQRILANLTSEWLNADKDKSYLMHGARLEFFARWLDETALSLTAAEQELIRSSLAWKQEQDARELKRQAHEQVLEQRALIRLRLAVGVLLIGIIIAIGLSLFAFNQQSAAEDAQQRSEANAEEAQQNLLETWRTEALFRADIAKRQLAQGSPQTALLIALEAAQHYPDIFAPEMHTSLHDALYNHLQEVANYPHVQPEDGGAGEGQLGAVFNRDETLLLTWSVDGKARLWENDEQPKLIFPHDKQVYGAMFSPDESQILTWSADGTVRVWDAVSGDERHRFSMTSEESPDEVWGARWNGDGSMILAWTLNNGLVQVWRLADDSLVMEFQHAGLVRGVIWNKDETEVLSWSDDKFAYIWDEQGVIKQLPHEGTVFGARWNIAEDKVLTWSGDGTVRYWDLTDSAQTLVLNHDGLVVGARFNQAETRILSWSEDKTVRLWDSANGDELAILHAENRFKGALFSPDESQVLAWAEDGFAYVAASDDFANPAVFEIETDVQIPIVEGATWNQDGTKIMAWSQIGHVKIFNTNISDMPETVISFPEGTPIWFAYWIRNETQVMTVSFDGSVRIWDLNYQPVEHVMMHNDFVRGASWNKAETHVLTWSNDTTAQIWDLSGTEDPLVLEHETAVVGAQWNEDETHVLTWTADGGVFDWNLATGEAQSYFHDGTVLEAQYSQNEQFILSWSQDKTARVWGGASSLVLPHDGVVFGAAWNSDQTRILTWSEDGTVKIWNASTGELEQTLTSNGSVGYAYWFANDQKILSWTQQGEITVWDVASGAMVYTMTHDDVIKGTDLSKDQTRLLSWSNDRTLRIWNLRDGSLITQYEHLVPINGAVWNKDESLVLAWEEGSGTWGQGDALIWNPQDNLVTSVFDQGLRPIRGAKWSPDETEILTWSWDGVVKVWDLSGEREPIAFGSHAPNISFEEGIWNATWSQDGKRVLVIPSDGTARIFIVDMGELIKVAQNRVTRPLYTSERELIHLPSEKTPEPQEKSVEENFTPIPTYLPLLTEGTIVPTALPLATITPELTHLEGESEQALVLYSGNSEDYPVVVVVENSDTLEILASDGEWFYVKSAEVYGWVAQDAITYSGNLEDLPSTEDIDVQVCALPDAEFISSWAKTHWKLGCPVSEVTSIISTSQPYVNGIMTWRSDTRNIFVILNDGSWAQYADTWRPGEQLTCASYYTALGFGKVYCNNPEVQALLGAPTGPERIATLRVQNFEHGSILESLNIGRLILLEETELVYEK